MKKNYQMTDAAATGLAGPESVTVAMADLAAEVQEGLHGTEHGSVTLGGRSADCST